MGLVGIELLTNSIEYGGACALRLWTDRGHLVCEVHDKGHLTDRLAGRQPAPSHQSRGRGMLLVNHLADLVRTHTSTGEGATVQTHFAV